jgi:hypothetical protein
MSYAKKDEDADMPGFKLDRTSVFQDGWKPFLPFLACQLIHDSPSLQLFSHISQKMSSITHQDCCSSVYRRKVSYERSYHPLLWNLEALSEQGPIIATNGLLDHQGASTHGGGCHNVDEHNHEGHVGRK